MKVVGIALIVYHTNLALVFRHEHVNITIQWITVVSTSDYLAYTLSQHRRSSGHGGTCRGLSHIYAEPCISYHEAQEGSRSCEDR